MLFKKKKFPKLTSREVDIMNILWTSGKPLIASEIADCRPDLTINTVQAVLRKLLKYQLVEVADIVYSGTVLSRSYRPTITSEEFAVHEVTSDYLAFGMMRAINEKGYSIPEDFGIVGYDNIEISGYVNPRLTTVEQNQKLFGKTLWSVITDYNKTGKYQNIELPQKIKMRGSC